MKKNLIIIMSVCSLVSAQAQNKIDRTKKPAAGPAPVIMIADPASFKLPNGITVMVVENHKLPKISATYSIDAGPITEGKKAGVVDLMGQMLNEGTKKMSKAKFDEAVDLLGADVNVGASGGSVSALTRFFDKAFSLMAEALQQPSFPEESFEKLKSQTLTGLKADEKNVKSIAGRVTSALTYGIDHPKGEFETAQTISALTLNDVKEAYAKYITPSRGYLTFVGDITPAKAKQLATAYLGAWKGNALKLETVKEVSNPSVTEIDFINADNAAQAEINVTNVVSIPLSSPDYFPVILANQILGGGAESRLFMNLREKHGFTYGAYSNVGTGRFQTSFNASAAVRNEKVDSAIAEFLSEINKMKTDKVSDEELAIAKALYNGNFALAMENPARIAQFAMNILTNELPKDFYRTYLTKINAVTKEDIQRVAQKYFNDKNTRVVVVAKGEQVLPSLARLNIPVKQYDSYAMPVTAAPEVKDKAAAPANAPKADAQTIVASYIKALGGEEEVAKINSILVESELETQGMKLTVTQKQMSPNMEAEIVSMAGSVFQKSVFDGTKGYQEIMGNKTEIPAEEGADKKLKKHWIEQLAYKNGYKLNAEGTEKVGNNNAYKISVTSPSGKMQTEWYDIATGLLLKTESTVSAQGVTATKTMEYGDYKKVGNFMFPYKHSLTISANGQGQTLEMNVKSVKLNEGVTAADFK